MYLENVEYSVICIGDFAAFPWSAGSAETAKYQEGDPNERYDRSNAV